jgi:hypothetical protein
MRTTISFGGGGGERVALSNEKIEIVPNETPVLSTIMCYIVLYQEQNKIIFFIEMFAS